MTNPSFAERSFVSASLRGSDASFFTCGTSFCSEKPVVPLFKCELVALGAFLGDSRPRPSYVVVTSGINRSTANRWRFERRLDFVLPDAESAVDAPDDSEDFGRRFDFGGKPLSPSSSKSITVATGSTFRIGATRSPSGLMVSEGWASDEIAVTFNDELGVSEPFEGGLLTDSLLRLRSFRFGCRLLNGLGFLAPSLMFRGLRDCDREEPGCFEPCLRNRDEIGFSPEDADEDDESSEDDVPFGPTRRRFGTTGLKLDTDDGDVSVPSSTRSVSLPVPKSPGSLTVKFDRFRFDVRPIEREDDVVGAEELDDAENCMHVSASAKSLTGDGGVTAERPEELGGTCFVTASASRETFRRETRLEFTLEALTLARRLRTEGGRAFGSASRAARNLRLFERASTTALRVERRFGCVELERSSGGKSPLPGGT